MSGTRVLVVDDEPTVREVVARYLERDGYIGVMRVELPTSDAASAPDESHDTTGATA